MIFKEIAIYEKNGEAFINSVQLTLDMEKLKTIFIPQAEDPTFLKIYNIGESEYSKLKYFYPELENYDLTKFDLFMESFRNEEK